jgi:hypothetical protein
MAAALSFLLYELWYSMRAFARSSESSPAVPSCDSGEVFCLVLSFGLSIERVAVVASSICRAFADRATFSVCLSVGYHESAFAGFLNVI